MITYPDTIGPLPYKFGAITDNGAPVTESAGPFIHLNKIPKSSGVPRGVTMGGKMRATREVKFTNPHDRPLRLMLNARGSYIAMRVRDPSGLVVLETERVYLPSTTWTMQPREVWVFDKDNPPHRVGPRTSDGEKAIVSKARGARVDPKVWQLPEPWTPDDIGLALTVEYESHFIDMDELTGEILATESINHIGATVFGEVV